MVSHNYIGLCLVLVVGLVGQPKLETWVFLLQVKI
jgi:hypothetical protein